MKKILISISIIVFIFGIAIIYLFYSVNELGKAFDKAGVIGIGKEITIYVGEGDIGDYKFVQESNQFELWNDNEKKQLINYMENNNLVLKPGKYKINQATKFENSLEKFRFYKQM